MLSIVSRWLTYLLALLYASLGVALFFLPARIAPYFAWNISPFVAMTMGGWCLGNAWAALIAARRWRWSQVYPILIYLWLFGILELLIVFLFFDKIRLSHPIARLYLLTLLMSVTAAIWGIVDWFRLRPAWATPGRLITPLMRFFIVLFVIFVGFLGLYGLFAGDGWPGTNGGIFPELMSPFTLRSFGAFYLSLALATATLWFSKRFESFLSLSLAALGLIIPITLAALWNIELFDFAGRPGGMAYIGVYVIVGAIIGGLMLKYGAHDVP